MEISKYIYFLLSLLALNTSASETVTKRDLGQYLFFDKRLSLKNNISCSSCHNPINFYTINKSFAVGGNGVETSRNPPVIFNRKGTTKQFWDGRVGSLKAQAVLPIVHPDEMGINDLKKLVSKFSRINFYKNNFEKLYQRPINFEDMIDALVLFEESLVSYDSAYDSYLAGNKNALSEKQKRGMDLFVNKFKCVSCHSGINFTNEEIKTRCYPVIAKQFSSPEKLSNLPKYKVPTLRNVEKTFPYFHNGSLDTLEDAIEFYNNTGKTALVDENNVSEIVTLKANDIQEIKEFLKSLTGKPIKLKKLKPIY